MAFTADTEKASMIASVPRILALLSELELNRFGTFFVLGRKGGDADTAGAAEHPEVIRMIVEADAEVGGHGDIHTRFFGQPPEVQRERVADMLSVLQPLTATTGNSVLGFRAPYLSADRTTWRVLGELGLAYDSSDADVWSETTLPFFNGSVWQLPPSMPMDWHLLLRHGLESATATQLFLDKLEYVVSRRGMFSWVCHPWLIDDYPEVLRAVLESARARDDLWFARMDDIVLWWSQREQLRLEWLPNSSESKHMQLRNLSDRAVAGAAVWLRLPAVPGGWIAHGGEQRLPLVERSHGGRRYLVAVLPEIPALGDVKLSLTPNPERTIFFDGFEAR